MPLSNQTQRKIKSVKMYLPLIIGTAAYLLLCLLIAYGIQKEWIPTDALNAASLAALSLSALVIAMMSRGGREGLFFGCCYAVLYTAWKLISCGSRALSADTAIGLLICGLCPWLFSCIFHKSGPHYTNRNRKKRR